VPWFDPDSNETSYCTFTGLQCDQQNYVTILDLNALGLDGTIPDSVSDLERLNRLRLDDNSLRGTIPNSLAELTSLVHLNLGGNSLSGHLPDFSSLSRLRRLKLGRNAFSGTIPPSLCQLKTLVSLDLEANTRLEGSLPSCLSGLQALNWLRVTEIGLQGEVPRGLCGVRNMNGFEPNTFGCDVIACPEGFHRRGAGRQIGNDTCVPCDVPSNTLGSTSCHWVQDFDSTTRSDPLTSPSPSNEPSISPSDPPPSQVPSLREAKSGVSVFPTASPLNEGPTEGPSIHSSALHSTVPSSAQPSLSNWPSAPPLAKADGVVAEPTDNGLLYEQGGLVGGTVSVGTLMVLIVVLIWRKRRDSTGYHVEMSPNESSVERSVPCEPECLPPQRSLSTIDEEDSEIGISQMQSNEGSILESPSSVSSRRVRFSLPDPWPDESSERISDVASAGAPSNCGYDWALRPSVNSCTPTFDEDPPNTFLDDKLPSNSVSSPILLERETVPSDYFYGLHAPSSEREYTGIFCPNGGASASDDDSVRAAMERNGPKNAVERWHPVDPDVDEYLSTRSGMAEI